MQTTAKTVKANIRSLLAKANKETGKEHTNLSDAFEDLALGYGVDQTEVFDGNIELEGDFEPGEPNITDYYQNGYNEGYTKGLEVGGGPGSIEEGKAEVYSKIEPINAQLENILYGADIDVEGTVVDALGQNVNQANSDFMAIKNKIVEKGVEVADGTRTAEYASKIGEVYEAGRKSQYDEFWDAYQNYGNRYNYENAFGGWGWNSTTLKPKYDLVNMTNINQMFANNKSEIDLVETFEKAGIIFDMESSYSCSAIFFATNFTRVGVVDLTNTGAGVYSIFANSEKMRTVEKLIIPNRAFNFNNWFYGCYSLENLIIEGVIPSNGFNVQWSTKLSKASWVSIMTTASTTASITITGSLVSVNKAFETSPGANDGSTSPEWLALKAARPTVSVSLV